MSASTGSIWLLVNYNQYESKRHFAAKLAEAFRRLNITVHIVDQAKLATPFDPAILKGADFSCSFNRMGPNPQGRYLWDASPIPHVSFLLDPVIYYQTEINTPYAISTCVDRSEYAGLRQHGHQNICLFHHGVEKDLAFDEKAERPYDVVFLGSSYDPESVRSHWQTLFPPTLSKTMDDASDIFFSQPRQHFVQALRQSLQMRQQKLDEAQFGLAAYFLDQYIRGLDRVELIRAIKDAKVHIFGGAGWRQKIPVRGWDHYFTGQPNVTIHPEIPFTRSIEILKQSKIALNSMPFFPDGSHERVLYALACGALPVTNDSLYFQELFTSGEEIEFYTYQDRAHVNSLINKQLAGEAPRRQGVSQGRWKVMQNHTWDNRAEKLLQDLAPILEHVKGLLAHR